MSFSSTETKIRDLASALEWLERAPGDTVFTNGVFDLLHGGHVSYLERARSLGDRLVVGVNSDRSARALDKGPGRPFVSAGDRARVLAGLAAVDCVILFEEPTPLALIEALDPKVLVKGSDYARDQVVGAELVESRGGRVELIPVVPDQSTSLIVERIRASR